MDGAPWFVVVLVGLVAVLASSIGYAFGQTGQAKDCETLGVFRVGSVVYDCHPRAK